MFRGKQVVEGCLGVVRERAAQGGVALRCDVPAGLPELLADTGRLRQVLINVLSNAVKFTLPGGVVGITFVAPFLDPTWQVSDLPAVPGVEKLLDHVDHAVARMQIEHLRCNGRMEDEHRRLASLLEASGERAAARGHRLRALELEAGA